MQCFVVVYMLVVVQCIDGFMDIDIVQRNGCVVVFEDFGDVVVGFQLYVVGVFYIQDWCYVSFYFFQVGDMGYQCFMCQLQVFVQQCLEGGFIVFCFQGDVWQVEIDYVEVIVFIMYLFVVFVFLYFEEVVIVYWCFK